MEGFVFPNEAHVHWGLSISLYPYLTGLVAGAFIVSSLYHVFNITALRPVSRFSLLLALVFLQVCPLPLVFHAGRFERGFEMFLTPKPGSAMAGFGYIWATYNLLVLFECWLAFRKEFVERAEKSNGVKKLIFTALSLGSKINDETLKSDHKLTSVLAAVGIPMACTLHGYVGFIFGGVKANPWWSSALMPIIFLLSAIVSGIAMLTLLYILFGKIGKMKIDPVCLNALASWLTGFLILGLTLELVELGFMWYEWEESWEIISHMLSTTLYYPFFFIQITCGSFVPLLCLGFAKFLREKPAVNLTLIFCSSALVLLGVWTMRLNVIIGGQIFSKSLRGLVHFEFPLLGNEGILLMGLIWAIPFVVLVAICRSFPPWDEPVSALSQHPHHESIR
jgi:Ni/Fe-hydrogenase subunit HybB-like protein